MEVQFLFPAKIYAPQNPHISEPIFQKTAFEEIGFRKLGFFGAIYLGRGEELTPCFRTKSYSFAFFLHHEHPFLYGFLPTYLRG